jgi:hypothetical protein
MDKAVLNSMTDAERRLVAETEAAALAPLDEDELLELLSRIRRARTKYVKNYRRTASAKVGSRSSRGTAYAENQRSRDKAEIFELALARVSRQVGRAAAQSAAELKAERIAAARTSGAPPVRAKASAASGPAATPATPKRRATKTTGGTKKDASSQAQGARRQARRDAR